MEEQKSLDALLYRFKKLRYINKIAGEYYSRKNKQIVIPSIIISAIASILSFLATSGGISEKEKEYLSIAVGCITILSTTLQTFSTTFGFNTRHDAFQRCADEYNKILIRLKMKKANCVNLEISTLVPELEKQAIEITNGCKYLPPQWVYEKWSVDKLKDNVNQNMSSCINNYDIENISDYTDSSINNIHSENIDDNIKLIVGKQIENTIAYEQEV